MALLFLPAPTQLERLQQFETLLKEPTMREPEETPSSGPSPVVIGRNGKGEWVVQERSGLFGGLFVSSAQAMKYALFENGHRRENIVLTEKIVELDTARKRGRDRKGQALRTPSGNTPPSDHRSGGACHVGATSPFA